MSERPHGEGHKIEHKETKAKPTEVARVFLFQSIDPRSLPETGNVENWNFTETLLIKKAGTKSTDQLSPVGGKINTGEKPYLAARREVVEETHLRPTVGSTRELKHSQNYSLDLGGGKKMERTVRYYVGQILPRPMDRPYALDVEEDKIASFEYLNRDQFEQLLSEGTATVNGQTLSALDSLRRDSGRTDKIITDDESLDAIHNETLSEFRLVEASKKLSVLEHAMWAVRLKDSAKDSQEYEIFNKERQEIFSRIEALRNILKRPKKGITEEEIVSAVQEAEELWKDVVRAYQCTPEQVRRALKNSNIEEMRDHATERFDLESGAGVPTINFIFPLLISDESDLRERRTLMRNPQMLRLMKISDTFWHLRQVQEHGEEAAKSIATLAQRFRIPQEEVLAFPGEGIPSQAINYFNSATFVTRHEKDAEKQKTEKRTLLSSEFFKALPELSKKIDEYFETLYAAADVKDVPLDQHELVKNASILQLWDIAFNTSKDIPRDPEEARMVRFEASRKLGLMMMLFEAEQIQKEVLATGVKPIQDIENALGTFEVVKNQGTAVVKEGVFGPENYAVKTYTREKELLSYFRKIIVRDEASKKEAMDTFAKSIVVTETSDKALAALAMETVDFKDKVLDKKYKPIGKVEMPHFVRELISGILEEAERQGQRVRIVQYKEFPPEGETFKASSGPGGTGNVRMGKFYVEHTDSKGIVRNREMQIFLPRLVRSKDGSVERIESGEMDFEAKKLDDKTYSVSRLFSTEGLRSFMELMYPAEIYGDSIRPIYKTKAK